MKAQAFNPQIFVEFLCYLVFGGLMLFLVSSGQYLSYVTPRMEPYLYFTATVMGIWAFVGLGRLFRPQHKVRAAHCFVLAIPILLLLLPHSPLNTADLSGNYIGGNTFASQSGQNSYGMPQEQVTLGDSGLNATTSIPTEYPSGLDTTDDSYATTPPKDGLSDSATTVPDTQIAVPAENSTDLDVANKRITVSNDDFGTWLTALYEDMRAYEGYTIVMTGFVFKDTELFKEDEFVTARLMMSCCVADLSPAGLICKYDKTSELEADSWVTVEGTLFIGQYEYGGQTYDDPQISVTNITPAEEVEGYVYPY